MNEGAESDQARQNWTRWLRIEFLVIPLFIIAALTLYWVDSIRVGTLVQRITHEEQEIFQRDTVHLAMGYGRVMEELIALNRQLNDAGAGASPDQVLLMGMQALMMANPHQMQVRWIDEQGRERIRFDREDDQVLRISEDQLQSKAHRDYTRKTLALAPGQFFISAIDLNVEHNVVERPFKPTFRIALRLTNARGFLIVNQNASSIFESLQAKDELIDTWLINSEGDWLKGPQPELDWGFILGEHHHIRDIFSPQVSDLILKEPLSASVAEDKTITLSYKLPLQALTSRYALIDDQPILIRQVQAGYFHQANAQSRFAPLTMLILFLACLILFLFLRQWRKASLIRSERKARGEEMGRLHGIANLLPQLTWTCTPEGSCDFISQSWADYTGSTPDLLIGTGWVDFVHPDDHEELFRCWTHSVNTGEDFFIRFRIRSKAGQYRMFDTRARALKDSNGSVLQWFGSNTDIEDTISYEKRLEQERERLRAELQISDQEKQKVTERLQLATLAGQVGIWEYDMVTQMLIWDERMFELYGDRYSAEALPFTHWQHRVHPKDLPGVERIMGEALDNGDSLICEFRIIRPDDSIIWVKADAFIVRDEAGNPLRMVGSNRDISESKQLMAELEEANEHLTEALDQAKSATRAKSYFLANMSHEIRTPMNGIVGMLALLNQDETLSPQQREYCQLAYQSSEHLTEILNDILDLSRIESGRVTLSMTDFSLQTLLQEAVEVFALSARQKQVELRTHIAAGTPDLLISDPLRVSQIVSNIVGNAVKFTPEMGRIDVSVAVVSGAENSPSPSLLRIAVKDTGIGISQAQQGEIFKAFTQADASTTRRFGGTGLGLTICQQLAELLDGSIAVNSEEGEGTEFILQVPVQISELNTPDTLASGEGVSSVSEKTTTLSLSGLKVLTVDDQPLNNLVVEGLMRYAGVPVRVAGSGAEAVSLLENEAFDLVLMDVHMEGMSGLEATRRIRQLKQIRQPLIFGLSASVMEEDQQRGLDAGMDTYLMKPFKLDDLFEALSGYQERLSTLNAVSLVSRSDSEPASSNKEAESFSLPECIDPEDFKGRLKGDYDLLMQCIQAFVQSAKDEELPELHGSQPYQSEAVAFSHKIKGAARSIGDTELAETAFHAEMLSRDEASDPKDLTDALKETEALLHKHLALLKPAIRQWQGEKTAATLAPDLFQQRGEKLWELADAHRFIPTDYWQPYVATLKAQGHVAEAEALANAFVAFDNQKITDLLESLQTESRH